MLSRNNISILRKSIPPQVELDFCLLFSGNGNIKIDNLNQYVDYRNDFQLDIEFNVKSFPLEGYMWLINSCIDAENNKMGTAIDGVNLYVQIDRGSGDISELYLPFSDSGSWHQLSIINNRGTLSAALDHEELLLNHEPALHLPDSLGFILAANTALLDGLIGYVDNILLTDLRAPIAQYLLNEGEGDTAYDSVNGFNGIITKGDWQLHI
ncbi:MAG: hypothetical protein KQI35_17300 [Bacteroidetes bacterium]|nr:hypothetical protein [Bacteroidota bacterium]